MNTPKTTSEDVAVTVRNLNLAADWIEENIPEQKLVMENFRSRLTDYDSEGGPWFETTVFCSKNNCGTAGCLLGWCPFVPDLEAVEEDFNTLGFIYFGRYSQRIFPAMTFDGSDWNDVFSASLDNNLKDRVAGMRDKARELEKGLWSGFSSEGMAVIKYKPEQIAWRHATRWERFTFWLKRVLK